MRSRRVFFYLRSLRARRFWRFRRRSRPALQGAPGLRGARLCSPPCGALRSRAFTWAFPKIRTLASPPERRRFKRAFQTFRAERTALSTGRRRLSRQRICRFLRGSRCGLRFPTAKGACAIRRSCARRRWRFSTARCIRPAGRAAAPAGIRAKSRAISTGIWRANSCITKYSP